MKITELHSARIDEHGETLSIYLTTARGGTLSIDLPLEELVARGVLVEAEQRPLLSLVNQVPWDTAKLWRAKDPDEVKCVLFDFNAKVQPPMVLSNPTFAVALVSGPGTAADLALAPLTTQQLQTMRISLYTVPVLATGGRDGAKYQVRCECDADNGEHHVLEKTLKVSANGALVR